MVFVGGRTSWTLIKWSTSLRINDRKIVAEIGTLQVAPASAQRIDGMVTHLLPNWITSGRIVALTRNQRKMQGRYFHCVCMTYSHTVAPPGRDSAREVPGAVDDARLLAPKTEGRPPARLVLNFGLQVVQDGLRRRTNVVDVDQVVHEPPHQ